MHFILKLLNSSIIMRREETKLVGVFMGLVCWFVVFSPLFSFFGTGSINYSWEKEKIAEIKEKAIAYRCLGPKYHGL